MVILHHDERNLSILKETFENPIGKKNKKKNKKNIKNKIKIKNDIITFGLYSMAIQLPPKINESEISFKIISYSRKYVFLKN